MGSTKAVRFQKYLVDSTSKLYQAFAFTEIVIIIIIITITKFLNLIGYQLP